MSFLPGLNLQAQDTATTTEPTVESRQIAVPAGSEWRFEVNFESTVNVKLLSSAANANGDGNKDGDADLASDVAEIFGTELAPNRPYTFCGAKAAVYTPSGCILEVSGPGTCESEYVAEETPMVEYQNVHFALENLRAQAAQTRVQLGGQDDDGGGPRVLVLGPDNAGKTSLIKTLTSYASRMGRSPMVVNLDPREGMLCLPGSLSAAVFGPSVILDVEDVAGGGWGSSPIAGPSAIPVKMPLVYHYGWEKPEQRPELFKPIVTRMALAVTSRLEGDVAVRDSGILAELAGSVCAVKEGMEIIAHVISELSITTVLVIGSERLYSDINRRFGAAASAAQAPGKPPRSNTPSMAPDGAPLNIVKLPKSGGAVDLDSAYARTLLHQRIRNYFFGSARATLSPHTQLLDINSVTVLRMVDPSETSSMFLPGGLDDDIYDDRTSNQTQSGAATAIFAPVNPSLAMQNAVLAIKHAAPNDPHETIRDASVMGYLFIADVDEGRGKVRVLSPVAGRLPGRALVWGRWPESGGDLLG